MPPPVPPLEPPDTLYLRAALGWMELGNPHEAVAELERITPGLREHPAVLRVRWQMASLAKCWLEALGLAEQLCGSEPDEPSHWIHRSYCLHELARTKEAWDSLLPLAERFPAEWLICYNLACYACQLGWLEQGKAWFGRALEIGNPIEIKRLAAEDPDLRPLLRKP